MSVFADLVPTSTGARPVLADYRGDPTGFRDAMDAWRAARNGAAPTASGGGAGGGAGSGSNSALSAFNRFYNSPTYQVPLKEGLDAVNTKYAALGAIESGAAMKAIDQYGADHAASALGTYMDDLYRQEALGMSASSALAGVGQNLVSQVSANNNAGGSAAGNAILTGGQATANNWNNVGRGVGTIAGTVSGALSSSYGGGAGGNISVDPALLNPQPVGYMPGAFY